MRVWTRLLAASMLSMGVMVASGCLAVAAVAGTGLGVAYAKGDLESVVDATPQEVFAAAKAALGDMDIRVLATDWDDHEGAVNARTAQDKKIIIKVAKHTETTSTLSIRIGTFGDEAMSQTIYEKIKARL